jgi:trigger factor
MNPGDTKDVTAVFPEEYAKSELAGKTAIFTVTVHDVKALEVPPIDDAFAQSISENETLDALKADVRTRLEAIAEGRARRAAGNELVEKLIAAHDFPLPDVLVEREIDNEINDLAGQVGQSGLNFDDYLKEQGKSVEDLRADFKADAETRVKGTLIIEEIARREGIVATPADIAEELAALSRQYGQPVDRIRKALGNNVLSLMDGIVRNKTLEFLIENAKLIEKA